ncbi:hypothetical protein [Rugosimonospora africana]|uniref:Uncharacterized protein n=1 Tax=Rugosimonospora africana TaxID=556532 RepID=A0A8J3QMA7_9ACTN|nr:hypothetical protein [Rugosimonospora africana]GIH12172.1 hypothetical protein Raf01_03440 [Rugosimonospora africana]
MGRLGDDDSTSGYGSLEVDLAGLADFARVLREEQSQRFAPVATTALDVFQSGQATVLADPAFAELGLARSAHQLSLDQAVQLLSAYSVAMVALADAADEVANRYAGSDAFAEATIADVGGQLSQMPSIPAPDQLTIPARDQLTRRAV